MEFPRLRLGLIGFDVASGERLAALCARMPAGGPIWQLADPLEADAWLVQGGSADVSPQGAIVVRDASQPGGLWSMTRESLDRPLAFALPVPPKFASAECHDVGGEKGLRRCLQTFEAFLRPLRAEFELAAQLAGRVAQHKGGVVHLVHEGRLLAVVDLDKWVVGVHPQTRPIDIASAEWLKRPPGAADIPGSFNRQPFHRLMWSYAMRSNRDVLPSRYRQQPIHFRRTPAVPDPWLNALHRQVISQLQEQPCTFEELQTRFQVERDALGQCLEALYFGGAITTNASYARSRRSKAMPHLQKVPQAASNRPIPRRSPRGNGARSGVNPLQWLGRALWMGRFGRAGDALSSQSSGG